MAKVHKSAASLLNAQQARFAKMRGSLVELHDKSAREAYFDLQRLSSGPIKTATLRKLGHPYGRGGAAGSAALAMRGTPKGRARLREYPINLQTGKFRRSIYLKSRGRHSYRLGASAPYAKYLLSAKGTKRMVRRDVFGGRLQGGRMGQIERLWRARLKGIRQGMKRASH